jgi:hypothetical protein
MCASSVGKVVDRGRCWVDVGLSTSLLPVRGRGSFFDEKFVEEDVGKNDG